VDGTPSVSLQVPSYGHGMRVYSDMTPGHAPSPMVAHYPQGQQPLSAFQPAPGQYSMLGTPMTFQQASPVQTSFSFLPGLSGSQLCAPTHFQFEAGGTAPAPAAVAVPAASATAVTVPVLAVAPGAAAPATAGVPVPVAAAGGLVAPDRATLRDALCEQAFKFVDAQQTGHIDAAQNKTGLTMVFERLGDVPLPKDEWYTRVFQNFAREGGLVTFRNFREIVVQWDDHHLKKRQQKQASETNAASLPPPPPPADAAAAARPATTSSSAPSSGSEAPSDEEAADEGEGGDGAPPEAQAAQDVAEEPAKTPTAAPAAAPASAPASDSVPAPAAASTPTASPKATPGSDAITRGPSRGSSTGRVSAASLTPEVMFPSYEGRLAIFDDYEFFGDVGSGSFGKVMVVRHRQTKLVRACKVVAVQTELQRDLIDTEIKLLKSLNHPNIMKLHEVYYEQKQAQGRSRNGNIYLVTELCEGGDLFSRILHHYERLKTPMTESHVAFMMKQILSATMYCHDLGIVHRDIKPENILFVDRTASSALKIIDFGLADFTQKIVDKAREVKVPRSGAMGKLARMIPTVGGKHVIPWHERKKVMQSAGTPHYMAPEMIQGYYDEKADLFSIGIILCQLLTGWHPFYVPGDDEQAVRAKITAQEPVEFPQETWAPVSRDALDLSKQLLDRNAKTRFSAAQALSHIWFKDPAKPSPYGNVEGLSVSIFEGLKQYQAYNKLKRAVLQLLTRELSEFQIQELRSKFMALDREGDGLLSPSELLEGMRHVGYEMSAEELDQVLAALDPNSRRIGYKEFVSALIERRVKFDRQQLWECFKKFDTNNSGRITYEDVRSKLSAGITESEWQDIAGVAKPGADGVPDLTFDDFCALMEQTEC